MSLVPWWNALVHSRVTPARGNGGKGANQGGNGGEAGQADEHKKADDIDYKTLVIEDELNLT